MRWKYVALVGILFSGLSLTFMSSGWAISQQQAPPQVTLSPPPQIPAPGSILTWHVNGDDNVCKDNDPSDYQSPYCTIQQALNRAQWKDALVTLTLHLSPGTYHENVDVTLSKLQDKTIWIEGAGAGQTIVDGDTDNDNVGDGPVFKFTTSGGLKKMTIQNGYHAQYPGGIWISGTSNNKPTVLLQDLIIQDNKTDSLGGGLGVVLGTVTLNRVTLRNNEAGSLGGAINSTSNSPNNTNLTITNSSLHNNKASLKSD